MILSFIEVKISHIFLGKMMRKKKRTLDNINLKIDKGEFIAIIGVNGSGKSTLAKHLMAYYCQVKANVLLMA